MFNNLVYTKVYFPLRKSFYPYVPIVVLLFSCNYSGEGLNKENNTAKKNSFIIDWYYYHSDYYFFEHIGEQTIGLLDNRNKFNHYSLISGDVKSIQIQLTSTDLKNTINDFELYLFDNKRRLISCSNGNTTENYWYDHNGVITDYSKSDDNFTLSGYNRNDSTFITGINKSLGNYNQIAFFEKYPYDSSTTEKNTFQRFIIRSDMYDSLMANSKIVESVNHYGGKTLLITEEHSINEIKRKEIWWSKLYLDSFGFSREMEDHTGNHNFIKYELDSYGNLIFLEINQSSRKDLYQFTITYRQCIFNYFL